MTEAEAKELKPGDRVLVEVVIQEVHEHFIYLSSEYVDFRNIREKVSPPRRKFKKGDIVAVKSGSIYYVVDDEDEGEKVYLSITWKSTWDIRLFARDLTLVCAVENREDRKEGEV